MDAHDTVGVQDVDLMLFDKVIAFDHYGKSPSSIVIISLDHYERIQPRAGRTGDHADHIGTESPAWSRPHLRSAFDRYSPRGLLTTWSSVPSTTSVKGTSSRSCFQPARAIRGSLWHLRCSHPEPFPLHVLFLSSDMRVAGASRDPRQTRKRSLHTFPLAGHAPRGATRRGWRWSRKCS